MQAAASKFRIDVEGSPLAPEVDTVLMSAVVDDSLNLPDLFVLEFRDNNRDVLTKARVEIGSKVKISVASESSPEPAVLLIGEVTALETQYDKAGTRTVVRGFDHSYRLFRGRSTRTWQNVTLSDVAVDVAKSAGLELGTVDATTAVVDHITQANISNWDFLKWLGQRGQRDVLVTDKKLLFTKQTDSSEAPQPGSLSAKDPLQLKLGENLREFRAIVTSAEQVEEVQVRGWDVKQKRALVGSAPAKTQSAQIPVTPVALAQKFGSRLKYVGTETPFGVQHEVDDAAKALAEQIAGAFAEFDGVADGNPKMKAGCAISLGSIGPPFEGKYVLTSTRHVFKPATGYTTWFTVSGKQERSLLGLASVGLGNSASPGGPRISGVANAIVTDVRDPLRAARVRLKFPWLSEDYVSDWCRVLQIGAGERGRGTLIVPEVNDEVLVAFEQGDIRRPYVIGGLYNGVDAPRADAVDKLVDQTTGKIAARHFYSRQGHTLSFIDKEGEEGIVLRTGDDKHVLELSKSKQKIIINGDGSIEIKGRGDVKIETDGSGTLKAAGKLTLQASAGITIDGGASVDVKGGVIKLN